MNSKIKAYRVAIIILSVLLAISLVLLAIQFIRKISATDKVTLSNSIGAVEKGWVFSAENVLPGDSFSKDFPVTLTHTKDTVLSFTPSVTADSGAELAKVLNVKVEYASGTVMCEGKLSDINGKTFEQTIAYDGEKQTELTFRITVTMDTSAGNEYQNSSAEMSFRWSIATESEGGETK